MPPPPEEEPNPLIALFRQCVVCIIDEAGRFRGSGFFVAPGRVLTCGHVVHGALTPRVRWQDQVIAVSEVAAVPPVDSVINPADYPLPDLAVLGVEEAAGWGHPCAALTLGQPVLGRPPDGMYLAGYTIEHGPIPALTGATTEFESLITEDGHTFFKLKRGQLLPGFSGSALLDLGACAVAGIVESSRGRQADLGGFAVPAAELAAAFPQVLEANYSFHRSDDRWEAAAEAEKTRAAQRAGRRARLPLRPPVVPLARDEDVSAATILRPRHAVVKYVSREQLLGALADWCELEPKDGESARLWFVTGGGGFGKTRLAAEACREAEARGWTAGLLTPGTSEAKLRELAEWPGRLLIAVDYAENTPALIGQLAEELAARAPRPPVRIMLLVRRRASRADLLELFNEQREELLDALLRRASISRLEDAGSEVDRLELFRQAVRDFAVFLAAPPPSGLRPPRLRAAHFARPLYVLVAAYLARASADADVDALSETDLLRTLLAEHEASHWDRWNQRRHLGLDPADQRTAVAVATLLTAEGEDEALTVARLIPHFGGEPESRLIAIARWLAQLYPPPGGTRHLVIAPLEPDRLGEVLVGDTLQEHPELLAVTIDTASDRQLTQALTVASRIAREDQVVNAQLRAALDERLGDLFRRGFSADGSDLLSAVVTAMTTSRPVRGAVDAAAEFSEALPVWLRPLAVTVTALAVDGLRARAGDDPAVIPDLAAWLDSLANRLSDVGQRQEALQAAREAVTHYRQLDQENPAAYLPGLVRSLNSLANRLSEVGQRQEALPVAREAVTYVRELAQDDPAAYLPGLAVSLNNLANRLSEVGQRQEALPVAREAVTHLRELAQDNPDTYLPGLAISLSNLANVLSDVGQRQEALPVAREAVTHLRELAQDNPDTYLPGLAVSLNNLANRLSDVGQRQEALPVAREAVTIREQLARDDPDTYLPDLAMSLNNLASFLSNVGQLQEALEMASEAVTIRGQLAQDDPDTYRPYLATSLSNLANRLSDVSQLQEALEMASEAVFHYRELAQDSPAAYLPDLAMSLNNLGNRLSDVSQWDEALEVGREAVTIRRQLAQDNPAAYLPDLAGSLNNLGNRLSDVSQWDEALEVGREAVTHYRELAQDNPAAYVPDVAISLNNLARSLSRAGQRQEALEIGREALDIRRQLAQDDPAAYIPDVARSLTNLASSLSEAGLWEEALKMGREAVAIRRQLAQDDPAAYLPGLAASLTNVANFLSEAGEPDNAEKLFSDIVGVFPPSTSGVGHILLARGRWRAAKDRLADAIPDLTAALSAFEHDGDHFARGQVRELLRVLRQNDGSAFDHAWAQAHELLPVWLRHPGSDQQLADKITAWIDTADWPASKAYLEDNAAILLSDEAEATLEHLIDINPAVDTLQEHLGLLMAARTHGADAAYGSHQEQLLTGHLMQTLEQWLATRTWEVSRAFAATHSGELLQPTTLAILDDLGDHDLANATLRLHRGLLAYAITAGFDAAYDVLSDSTLQQQMLIDPATPAGARLAVARFHSGQADDDPEAHFQLAAATLQAILDQAAPLDQTSPLAREAAAALADCASNAAPYERREFALRLAQLGTEHVLLAPLTAGLQHILTAEPGISPDC
jgi:Trypsin-like peptidase domain/Tetratricopeptide repeat